MVENVTMTEMEKENLKIDLIYWFSKHFINFCTWSIYLYNTLYNRKSIFVD